MWELITFAAVAGAAAAAPVVTTAEVLAFIAAADTAIQTAAVANAAAATWSLAAASAPVVLTGGPVAAAYYAGQAVLFGGAAALTYFGYGPKLPGGALNSSPPASGGGAPPAGGVGGAQPGDPCQVDPAVCGSGGNQIDEARTRHIFREGRGHVKDTPGNRDMLRRLANDPTARLGVDKHGNTWYAQVDSSGQQVWAQVRDGRIINGGVSMTPRTFNPETGLSFPHPPR